jgi:hypothetical protein
MAQDFNYLLQNIYQTIVPKTLKKRFSSTLPKIWIGLRSKWSHRRKKTLNYLEIRLTDHCDLNCYSCEEMSPIAEENYIDPAVFESDFKRLSELTGALSGKEGIKMIRLMGGEPLLHPHISSLCKITRQYFPSSRVIIITNGIKLVKISEDFWNSCYDNNIEILISHYPIKIKYDEIKQKGQQYSVNVHYNTKEPQAMHKWTFDVEGKQDPIHNFMSCYFGNTCIQIDNGKLYNCSIIPCAKHFNAYFGKNMFVTERDYIDIYKVHTLNEILDFCSNAPPFCRYCKLEAVDYGRTWKPSKKEISEWT